MKNSKKQERKSMKFDLTQGSVKKHLIRMAIPMIWGILSIIAMNLVDTYFVGQLGTAQLAAMGFIFPVVMFRNSLAFGIGVGASSVIARALGAKDTEKVKSYTTQALILAFSISMLFAILGYYTIDPLFLMLGADPELLPYIHDYMGIWYFGCFLVVVPMVGNSAIRALGNTKFPSYVMMFIAVLNLILDPILIFGLFGFPRMELQGAALATVISYSLSFFLSLYILRHKLHIINLESCFTRVVESWKAILHVGIPSLGSNLIGPLSITLTTWLVAKYGAEAVAGYGVASRIEAIYLTLLYAFSSVTGPLVGQNWGAGRPDRVGRVILQGSRISLMWGVFSAVTLWIMARPLIGFFDDNAAVIESAYLYLVIIPITYSMLGVVMICGSMANGIGKPKASLLITFSRLIVIYLPLAFALSAYLGLKGLYLATALSNILVGVGAFIWSRKQCSTPEEHNKNNNCKVMVD